MGRRTSENKKRRRKTSIRKVPERRAYKVINRRRGRSPG